MALLFADCFLLSALRFFPSAYCPLACDFLTPSHRMFNLAPPEAGLPTA